MVNFQRAATVTCTNCIPNPPPCMSDCAFLNETDYALDAVQKSLLGEQPLARLNRLYGDWAQRRGMGREEKGRQYWLDWVKVTEISQQVSFDVEPDPVAKTRLPERVTSRSFVNCSPVESRSTETLTRRTTDTLVQEREQTVEQYASTLSSLRLGVSIPSGVSADATRTIETRVTNFSRETTRRSIENEASESRTEEIVLPRFSRAKQTVTVRPSINVYAVKGTVTSDAMLGIKLEGWRGGPYARWSDIDNAAARQVSFSGTLGVMTQDTELDTSFQKFDSIEECRASR
jgi:hypothetical protein